VRINEEQTRPADRTEGIGEEAQNMDISEMDDIRAAVAKDIHEMESVEGQQGNYDEGGSRREEVGEGRTNAST
jgi:hypothetical protein